ncbi:hypothetical protein D9M73_226580 [compost metagenome]
MPACGWSASPWRTRKRNWAVAPAVTCGWSMRNSTRGLLCRAARALLGWTSALKQWAIFGWLSITARSNLPGAGSLTRLLYTPGSTSRMLRSTTRAAREVWPRLR